ncbi:dehydrogenase/reductase SDR family member 11-like [Poecilia latipinna]|uniref:dehydrogenase/reductase SDR family member 11-like n=1 Tax=Poecilia latipinna TaxID=48699 RepID=UPI00072E9536|nr:PREDICTED: dehydrogenase/reductase SDR family member 11-like [Poecilia latipinna]
MDRWKGRVALVTGASVGIGATIAKELVQYGMTVVGCARSLDKIQALAVECKNAGHSGVLIPMKCDLTNAEDIQSMFAAIKAQHKGVDVCINNAGLAHNEPLLSGKTSAWKNMLDVRTHCGSENALAAECKSAGHSGVLIPMKCDLTNAQDIQSMFAAIKAQHKGVDVCINNAGLAHPESLLSGKTSAWKNMLDFSLQSISPGLVETEFAYRLHSETPGKAKETYSQLKPLEAIDVANAVVYVLSAPPHVQIGEMLLRPVEQQA